MQEQIIQIHSFFPQYLPWLCKSKAANFSDDTSKQEQVTSAALYPLTVRECGLDISEAESAISD